MGIATIYEEAEQAVKIADGRNPFDLLVAIGARVKMSYEYEPDGLKGFATIINRQPFTVINGHLSNADRRIVAGHEAAHLILHRAEILLSPVKALQDFNLYTNNGRLEHQANSFLADFLVSDKDILEAIANDFDYFTTAQELKLPTPLLAFKLYSMIGRGHNVKNPIGIESKFLGGS